MSTPSAEADQDRAIPAVPDAGDEETLRRSFEAGWESGIQEGRTAEREAIAASLKARDAAMVEHAAKLIEAFQGERAAYFEAVEQEVVKLALAIAGKILRREAQMDPLLLSGAVRVALGQLSNSTEVRLHVPAAEFDIWKETIAHLPNLAVKPAVVASDQLQLGECALETEMGSVDLGVASQLTEIERGLFDRTSRNCRNEVTARITEEMSE